ncbi:MAG TPA: Tn3 family transposase [Chthoniobacterales bacterium]|nr:Tn3 family transposase [Chthoniobacterales bacterium]
MTYGAKPLTITNSNIRLSLLSQDEYQDYYGVPVFDPGEQAHFFAFNAHDQAFLNNCYLLEDKIYMALMLGYFRAKHCLVNFSYYQVTADRKFILSTCFPEEHTLSKKLPPNRQQLRLQHKILVHENYRRFDPTIHAELLIYLSITIRQHPKVKSLFQALLDHIAQCAIALPGYSTLQKLVTEALSRERKRLNKIYRKKFSKKDKHLLSKLLSSEKTLSQLHNFKKDPKSFTYKEMRKELLKHELLKPIYEMAIRFIPLLELPQETINYYGSLVIFYNVYKLKRMKSAQSHLYCLCYSISRYQLTNDNLLSFFSYYVNYYDAEARNKSKDKLLGLRRDMQAILHNVGNLLELILETPHNESISKSQCFSTLPQDQMLAASLYLKGVLQDEVTFYWEHVDYMANKIRRNLLPLFMAIDFSVQDKSNLQKIVLFFKTQNTKPKENINLDPLIENWLPKAVYPYLLSEDHRYFQTHRLNFYFYRHLSQQMKTGKVYLTHSIKHRTLKDELIPKEKWTSESEEILKNIGYPKLVIPIDDLINQSRADLHTLIIEINQRIKDGTNEHVKIKNVKGKKIWTLPYEKKTDITNNPFFRQLSPTNIIAVLQQSNEQCHFLDELTPIQPHSIKTPRSDELKLGVIFANAIRLGAYKMGQTSDLSYHELLTTEKTCLRLETLRAAVDVINNKIAGLPIFPLWNLNETLHGSVDGSKIGTRLDILKSRYSPKYFGLYRGVSAYSLSVNHTSPAILLIGPHEYEGNFLYDIQVQNISDIQPKNVSGDGHSINRLNFTLLDMIDRGFMPCFPRLNQQILYCFGDPSQYEHLLIKPTKSINESLIKREWPEVKHVLASILSGQVSQSTVVSKLSSHDYISSTKEALWEYDNILRSIYILLYIDDVNIRQSVRSALNRGEAYHQLARAIAMLNEGEFRGASEHEVEIWNECARLVASAIIYYNSQLLSSLYEQAKNDEEKALVVQMSPVAWAHINLLGRYMFMKKEAQPDFKGLAKNLILKPE